MRISLRVVRCAGLTVAAGLLLGANCEFHEPEPLPLGTFTVRLSGAIDTVMQGGPAQWADVVPSGEPPTTAIRHALELWAEPPAGQATAPRISLVVTPGPSAPLPGPGVTYRVGGATTGDPPDGTAATPEGLGGSLLVRCRTGTAIACGAALYTRDDAPVTLTLTRVDADTVAGESEFVVSGWLSGQATIGPPPDTVRVVVEFVVPRSTERASLPPSSAARVRARATGAIAP